MKRIMAAASLWLVACGQTEECKELDKLLEASRHAASAVKGRAAMWERAHARLQEKETATKKLLAELGLDQGEEQLKGELEARVAKIPGASFERSVKVAEEQGTAPSGETETLFVINLPGDDVASLLPSLKALIASPPLLQLQTVVREGKGWRIELGRLEIDQIPIKVDPVRPPPRVSPDSVKSEFGFCGAGDKRKQLAALEEEIKANDEKAAELTTLLPAAASWEGLGRRAELVREVETEARRLFLVVLEAVQKTKVQLKAIGSEQELVMVELKGSPKDRSKLQGAFDPQTLSQVQLPETEVTPGVARFALPNRVAKERRRPSGEGGSPFPQPGDAEH